MTTTRIPPESFDFYVRLGPTRSYAQVAAHYGVHKRSITKFATRHGWARRLLEVETKARERSETSLVDAVDEMNQRHLKVAKLLQAKALQALQSMPIDTAMGAVRALDIGVKQERLVLGEPTDRSAVAVEDIIKREAARWLGNEGNVTWDDLAAMGPGGDGGPEPDDDADVDDEP